MSGLFEEGNTEKARHLAQLVTAFVDRVVLHNDSLRHFDSKEAAQAFDGFIERLAAQDHGGDVLKSAETLQRAIRDKTAALEQVRSAPLIQSASPETVATLGTGKSVGG